MYISYITSDINYNKLPVRHWRAFIESFMATKINSATLNITYIAMNVILATEQSDELIVE